MYTSLDTCRLLVQLDCLSSAVVSAGGTHWGVFDLVERLLARLIVDCTDHDAAANG